MSAEFNGYDVYCDGRASCRAHEYRFGEPGDDWDDIYQALERQGWTSPDDWQEKMLCQECTAALVEAEKLAESGHLIDGDGNVVDVPLFEVAS